MCEQLKVQADTALKDLNELDQDAKKLRDELEKTENEKVYWKNEAKKHENERFALKSEKERLQKRVSGMEDELPELKKEILAKANEIEQIKAQLDEREAQLQEAKDNARPEDEVVETKAQEKPVASAEGGFAQSLLSFRNIVVETSTLEGKLRAVEANHRGEIADIETQKNEAVIESEKTKEKLEKTKKKLAENNLELEKATEDIKELKDIK